MDQSRIIELLEHEWDLEGGCLGQLRFGVYDREGFERLIGVLRSVDLGNEGYISRRLVSLVWFIPTFVEWHRGRVLELGGGVEELDRQAQIIAGLLLEDIFGPP
jgi:hypothetical protein